MIQETAGALWAINQIAPKFEVTSSHPDQVVITSNLGGALSIRRDLLDPTHDAHVFRVMDGDEDISCDGFWSLDEALISACGFMYESWLDECIAVERSKVVRNSRDD